VSLYIFTPALVFDSLYEAEFNLGYMEILIFMFVLFYAMVFVNKMLAKIWKWEQSTESAAILATGIMNSGNYGLPVVLFSLGEKAVLYAIFIMVAQSLQNNFFGIYYASRSTSGMCRALKNGMKMVSTYAAITAICFQLLHVQMPEAVLFSVSIAA